MKKDKLTKENTVDTILKMIYLQNQILDMERELNSYKKKCNIRPKHDFNTMNKVEQAVKELYSTKNSEVTEVINECLKLNEFLSYTFFLNEYFTALDKNKIRDVAFDTLIKNPDNILKLFESTHYLVDNFTEEQKRILYNTYNQYFFEKIKGTVILLYDYCRLFKNYIGDKEKNMLVDRIISWKKSDIAKEIIRYNNVELNNDQIDKLNAFLLMKKLIN